MDWHSRDDAHFHEDLGHIKSARVPKPVTVFVSYCFQADEDFGLACRCVDEAELNKWLKEDSSIVAGRSAIAGFRLILSPRDEVENRVLHRFPFSMQTFHAIYQEFGLHSSLVRAILRAKPAFCSMSLVHRKTQNQSTGFLLRSNEIGQEDVILSTTVDSQTNVVTGIIHGCTDGDIDTITEWLTIMKADIFHPLLLPALTLDLIRTKYSRLIEEKSMELGDLSGTTDQFETIRSPDDEPLDEIENYNQTTKDVLQLHQEIGEYRIAVIQTRKQARKLMAIMEEKVPTCPVNPRSKCNDHLKEQLEEIIGVFDDLEMICGQITADCNLLMGAIYNIIAQRQNQINVGIAADSREISAAAKQDSSAMKAIAIMTMLFLPGTFVAAFFAMPLLNWAGGLSEHEKGLFINPRFKYYWIVTLPLTFLVLVGWKIWKSRVIGPIAAGRVGKISKDK